MSKRRFKPEEAPKTSSVEFPPMSRLFIVCSKQNTEEEFREIFSKFGNIQEIWLLKDRSSGESKGKFGFQVPLVVSDLLSIF